MNSARNSALIRIAILFWTAFLCLDQPSMNAQTTGVPSSTPAMGWNSWDSYGTTVNENQVKANADWMAKNLKAFGWQYVVVDMEWYIT